FVAAMEKCTVRDAATKLSAWFMVEVAAPAGGVSIAEKMLAQSATVINEPTMLAIINPPLSFQLKIDTGHSYGLGRGLTKETLEYFGAGLCLSRGMFAGQFVIPLHNEKGEMVG